MTKCAITINVITKIKFALSCIVYAARATQANTTIISNNDSSLRDISNNTEIKNYFLCVCISYKVASQNLMKICFFLQKKKNTCVFFFFAIEHLYETKMYVYFFKYIWPSSPSWNSTSANSSVRSCWFLYGINKKISDNTPTRPKYIKKYIISFAVSLKAK